MKSFFKNYGPFDINFLLKKTLYTKSLFFKKKNKVFNISSLSNAKNGDIVFFNNIKFLKDLNNTKASYCLIEEKFIDMVQNKSLKLIFSSNPLLDFILISKIFYPEADKDIYEFNQNKKYLNLKKKNTLIEKSVKIGKNFSIGLNSVLKKNIIIGNNVRIGSNCVISNSIIGNNVTINDGSIIGKIGFGFKQIKDNIIFIPHIGSVLIEDNVYIGSNCTIDRGTYSDTIISRNTMIDNQVHIAHNVIIGPNTFLAGQSGIAGSSKIGKNCMIGGKSGISGHLEIGDNVYIGGQSGVLKNVKAGNKIMGYPAISIKEFVKKMKNDY